MDEYSASQNSSKFSWAAKRVMDEREQHREELDRAVNQTPLDKLLAEQLMHLCERNNISPEFEDPKLSQEMDKIRRQNFKLKRQMQQEERELLELQTSNRANARVESFTQQILEYEQEVSDLNSEIGDYKAEVSELAEQAEASELALSQLEKSASSPNPELEGELSAAKKKIESLNAVRKRLEENLRLTVSKTNASLEIAADDVNKLYSAINLQDKRISGIEPILSEVRQQAAEISRFNEALELTEKRLEMRWKQYNSDNEVILSDSQTQREEHAQVQRNLTSQIAKYKEVVNSYEEEEISQEEALGKCKLVITEQQSKIEELTVQIAEINEEISRKAEEVQEARLESNKTTEELHQLQFCRQDVDILEENNKDLQEQLKRAAARLATETGDFQQQIAQRNGQIGLLNDRITALEDENTVLLKERENGDYSELYEEMKESYEQLKQGTDEIMEEYEQKLQSIKQQHERERQLNATMKQKQRVMESELAQLQRKCEQFQQSYSEQSQISVAATGDRNDEDYQRRFAAINQTMQREHQLIQKEQAEIMRLRQLTEVGSADEQLIHNLERHIVQLERQNEESTEKCTEMERRLENEQNDQSTQNQYIEQLQESIDVLEGEKSEIISQLRIFESQQGGEHSAEALIAEANLLLRSDQ